MLTTTSRSDTDLTVYVVLSHEGGMTQIENVWRTEEEAEDECARLRAGWPRYTFRVQWHVVHGAR